MTLEYTFPTLYKNSENEILLWENLSEEEKGNTVPKASNEEIKKAQKIYKNILRQEIKKNISTFSKKEQEILIMRFGLNDGVGHTLEDTGEKFSITRDSIRQLQDVVFKIIKSEPSLNKKMWVFEQ